MAKSALPPATYAELFDVDAMPLLNTDEFTGLAHELSNLLASSSFTPREYAIAGVEVDLMRRWVVGLKLLTE